MTAPRMSVVMGVCNGKRYIREAVDSILGQTFGDLELCRPDRHRVPRAPVT